MADMTRHSFATRIATVELSLTSLANASGVSQERRHRQERSAEGEPSRAAGLCNPQGDKHAVMDTPDEAQKGVVLSGPDSETPGNVIVVNFDKPGPCRGLDLGKKKVFYFDAADYEPMKQALKGAGKVSFYGVAGVKPAINNASWRAVGA